MASSSREAAAMAVTLSEHASVVMNVESGSDGEMEQEDIDELLAITVGIADFTNDFNFVSVLTLAAEMIG